jgi:hypothetical protein
MHNASRTLLKPSTESHTPAWRMLSHPPCINPNRYFPGFPLLIPENLSVVDLTVLAVPCAHASNSIAALLVDVDASFVQEFLFFSKQITSRFDKHLHSRTLYPIYVTHLRYNLPGERGYVHEGDGLRTVTSKSEDRIMGVKKHQRRYRLSCTISCPF